MKAKGLDALNSGMGELQPGGRVRCEIETGPDEPPLEFYQKLTPYYVDPELKKLAAHVEGWRVRETFFDVFLPITSCEVGLCDQDSVSCANNQKTFDRCYAHVFRSEKTTDGCSLAWHEKRELDLLVVQLDGMWRIDRIQIVAGMYESDVKVCRNSLGDEWRERSGAVFSPEYLQAKSHIGKYRDVLLAHVEPIEISEGENAPANIISDCNLGVIGACVITGEPPPLLAEETDQECSGLF